MPRPGRSFLAGCAVGVAAGFVLPIVLAFAATFVLRDWLVARQAAGLGAPPVLAGTPADLSWSAAPYPAGAGDPVPLGRYRGQTLFLHFWHPGCISCESEIPALNALHAAIAGSGVQMLAVAVKEPEAIAEAAAKHGIAYPMGYAPGPFPAPFAFNATPATYIVSPAGNVVFSHLGAARWDDPAMATFLRSLAAIPAAPPASE